MSPLNDLIPTRQSLLQRLQRWDDQLSWHDFFHTYWKLIYGVARKAGLNDADAQDVVQEVIITVAKKMPEFHYDPAIGTFKAWLMRLTRWRISDHFRRRRYQTEGERRPREQAVDVAFLEEQPDTQDLLLDALWNTEWERHVLEVAMDKVRGQASPIQFQIFQLHVVNRLPAREVAQRLGVKLPAVYFAKYKLTAAVRQQVRQLEEMML